MRTPSRPSRRTLLNAAILGAALLVSACTSTTTDTTAPWYGSDKTSTTPPTTPASTPPTTKPSGPSTTLDIYLDGWSYRTLEDIDLYATTGAAELILLDFQPLALEGTAALLDSHPEFVATVGARMVNTDFGWTCSADGCDTDATRFDRSTLLKMFTNPAQIPGYGPSYEAWGIPAALYKATIELPQGTEAIDVLGIPAGVGADISYASWNSRTYFDQIESLPLAQAGDDRALLLAAGLGRIFTPDPAWTEGSVPYNITALYGPPTAADAAWFIETDTQVSEAFSTGLAATSASWLLAELDPNELTYLTSPTIGCAPTVVCVPTTLDVESTEPSIDVFEVCVGSELLDGYNPEDEFSTNRVVAVFTSTNRQLTLPHPTHLNGVWGGTGPDQFTPASDPSIQIFSTPPLAEGSVELEVATVHLYLTSYASGMPVLWTQLGGVIEVDADEPLHLTSERLLSAVGALSTCD